MRLNKYLASAGIASRRKCDDLITAGRIKVNGKVVSELGTRIDETADEVRYDNRVVKFDKQYKYILLNKPTGYVSTVKDEYRRPTVVDLVPVENRVFPVGRLDYDTSGLLLLTNDGQLTNLLLHPKYKVEKIYHVLLDKLIKPVARYHLEQGIELEGKRTGPCKIEQIRVIDNCSLLEIRIREGRNRQIRKMFDAYGYRVESLDRIGFGPLTLSGLKRGEWRPLTRFEIAKLKEYMSRYGQD